VSLGGGLPFLKPRKVGFLLGTISTDGHAAPSPCMPSCLVEEKEDAVVALAGFDVPKVCRRYEFSNLFGDG
jgi:hypothetical protein